MSDRIKMMLLSVNQNELHGKLNNEETSNTNDNE